MNQANSNVIGAVQLANRRGFLLGITIAEVLIITLFVLLLLFRQYQEEAVKSDILQEALGIRDTEALVAINKLRQKHPFLIQETLGETWEDLINCAKNENLLSCNNVITHSLDDEELKQLVRDQKEELYKTTQKITAQNEVIEQLKSELGTKSGGLTICSYLPSDRSIKGKSLRLGVLHLEPDGITLVHKEPRIYQEGIVDNFGKIFDIAPALMELDKWQIHRKLSFEEFNLLGKRFKDIGERPVSHRETCAFYFDTFIHPNNLSTTYIVDRKIVQEYFLPGNILTPTEFETYQKTK